MQACLDRMGLRGPLRALAGESRPLERASGWLLARWTIGKESEKGMYEENIRCPYCVLGSEFRPMLRRSSEEFLCPSCGHEATLEDPYLKCVCERCRKMDQLAIRCRSYEEQRHRLAAGA
jgi:hypothetical protein